MQIVFPRALLVALSVLFCACSYAQVSGADFDSMDSMIAQTPQVPLCKKGDKDDLKFMDRAPEKYSNYVDEFFKMAATALTFSKTSNFFCDIDAEVNCQGRAGNYTFTIEPKTFTPEDYTNFKQLIAMVEKLQYSIFTPAVNVGENVNSGVHFRIAAKEGKPVRQAIPKK